jgi:hypothetical protein
MKISAALLALPAATFAALYSSEEYASGDVHQQLMEIKNVCWLGSLVQAQPADGYCYRHTGTRKLPKVF